MTPAYEADSLQLYYVLFFSFHDNISSVDMSRALGLLCHPRLSGARLNVQNSGSCQEILASLNCHFWLCFGFTLVVR